MTQHDKVIFCMSVQSLIEAALVQVEAAKVAKVREAAITKLKSLEKQKAEVEKTRDDIKYEHPPAFTPLPSPTSAPLTWPSFPPPLLHTSCHSSLAHSCESSSHAV